MPKHPMKISLNILFAAALLIGSAAYSQEPRPPVDPGEPRPPLPRDEFRQPDRQPATPPRMEQRQFDRERPHDLRDNRDFRPDRFRPWSRRHPERRMQEPGSREAAPRRDNPDVRPRGEFFDRPGRDFRPERRGERGEFFRPQERRFPDFREGVRPRRDFRPERPPMPPEDNFRNPDRRPEFRDFAPVARGPRPEMERPRERDDQWDHRAPRFLRPEDSRRDDRRDEWRRWERPQPLPFQ
jgi:hypothetical protein